MSSFDRHEFLTPGWLTNKLGNKEALNAFAQTLRDAEYLPVMLPRLANRKAFARFSDLAIISYCQVFDEYPELLSRMGRVIREKLGVSHHCPSQYIIKEAHIDLSETTACLADFILSNGFEPDNFESLNPPEYCECFTMRLEIPYCDRRKRSPIINSMLRERIEAIEAAVNNSKGILAYSEVETYSHHLQHKYDPQPVSFDALREFPFGQYAFESVKKPHYKKADVHVKISPTAGKMEENERILRLMFLSAGFYEIRSLSGNSIYTLQFVDIPGAKEAFRRLKEWADLHLCLKSLELEFISRFWRKSEEAHGRTFISPIPNVVGWATGSAF